MQAFRLVCFLSVFCGPLGESPSGPVRSGPGCVLSINSTSTTTASLMDGLTPLLFGGKVVMKQSALHTMNY